jgi:hypothetical protein
MFIGHYGVALAARRVSPQVPLGLSFLAVQFLDVLFSLFVLGGIEKMRIVPGYTAYNPYELYFMPYSHSLFGAIVWSAGAWAAYLPIARQGPARARTLAAIVLGAAVFSHFVLDALVHTPDLPLGFGPGSPKIGLGLWNHRYLAIGLELVTLAAGGVIYLRATRPVRPQAARATAAFAAVLVATAVATPFFPDPPSGRAFAVQALVSYGVLAAAAALIDRGRQPRTVNGR